MQENRLSKILDPFAESIYCSRFFFLLKDAEHTLRYFTFFSSKHQFQRYYFPAAWWFTPVPLGLRDAKADFGAEKAAPHKVTHDLRRQKIPYTNADKRALRYKYEPGFEFFFFVIAGTIPVSAYFPIIYSFMTALIAQLL